MASRETAFVEITPEVLLKAYACGIFPMAESADDPALYWIEPEKRGIIPLDSLPHTVAARPHRALGPLQHPRQPRLRRRARRLRRAAARPRAHLDQRAHPHALSASSTTSGIATASRPTRTAHWSAGSTACVSAARSSARACSTARATPRRWRWCIWWRGCAPAASAARHPVRHRSFEDVRRGRSVAAGSITSCWKPHWSAKPISQRSAGA